ETALSLGVRQVITKTSGGTTTTNYPVTPMGSNPGSAHNPQTGAPYTAPSKPVTATPAQLAMEGGTDTSGRPMMPSLFVTDITGLDPNSVAAHDNDWQYGGSPVAPNDIFGDWK